MSILGAIWRALLSLLLFFVTQASWYQISSEREIAHAQIEV